jgi:23S rRNA (uracil1939-C5)-methyltransferase
VTICKHFNQCGGCQFQDMPYDEQLEMKNKEVLKHLEANAISYYEYSGIVRSPKETRYRNKMEYTFGDEVKQGEMTLGMHKRKQFMSIVTVDECQLVDEDFNMILQSTLKFFVEKGYHHYNKKSHRGLQRNLILRKGENTSEVLINIVTTSQSDFDKKALTKLLLDLKLKNRIVGIVHTLNDSLSDFVYCDKLETLFGQDYYTEKLLGLQFNVSAFSFYQTNVQAIEALYLTALSYIDNIEEKTVFDLYSGTGTIAQAAARKAKKTIGIEIVAEAVVAAKENALLNQLENCTFYAGDVLDVLDELQEKPDVIILDPPRAGIMPKTLQKILNYRVNQIIYISCNPRTLSENLAAMQEYGYITEKISSFDNFPHTKHIECVALLRLKSEKQT